VLLSDFASGSDRLQLDLPDPALGPSGTFTAGDGRFWAAAGANSGHDADDRVVYNTTTGQLWFDADGSGSGAAQLLGTLQGAPTLAATDISVMSRAVQGTAGDDSITGGDDADSLSGGAGNDTIDGGGGNDTIDGGTGNDSVVGGDGADLVRGGDGNDTVDGVSNGNRGGETYGTWNPDGTVTFLPGDTLDGGLGDDYYFIQPNDVIVDAGGFDTVEVVETDITLQDGIEGLVERSGDGNDVGGVTTLSGNSATATTPSSPASVTSARPRTSTTPSASRSAPATTATIISTARMAGTSSISPTPEARSSRTSPPAPWSAAAPAARAARRSSASSR
jgi:hypothetical protein